MTNHDNLRCEAGDVTEIVAAMPADNLGPEIEVICNDPRWDIFDDIAAVLVAAAKAALQTGGGQIQGVTLLLGSDDEIRGLNLKFRGLDKPTNVLSFPFGNDGFGDYLGDIALSYDTIVREANSLGIDPQNHACHLTVHGVLHLLGYDHIDDNDAEAMEALEIAILDNLNIANPYLQNGVHDGAPTSENDNPR